MNVQQIHLMLIALRRRALLIGACVGLALALGIVYCVAARRLYEATASLLVEYNNETFNKSSSDLQQQARFDDMATQVKVIQSQLLLERALASLQPFQMDPALANLPVEERREAVAQFLQVSSPRGARLIHVAYRSPTPEAAEALVQAVTDSYLKFVNESHRTSAREVLEVLTHQKNDLETQLNEVDMQVAQSRHDYGVIMDKEARTSIAQKRIAALADELLKAQLNRLRAEGANRQVNAQAGYGDTELSFFSRLPLRFGEDFVNKNLGMRTESEKYQDFTARTSLINDELKFERIKHVYLPNHPEYKSLEARIQLERAFLDNPVGARTEELEKSGKKLLEFGKDWAKRELAEALAVERELQQKIANEKDEAGKQNAKYVRLQMLESKQDRLKSFYDVVLKRMKELDISDNISQINVTVIGPPTLLKNPVSPRITLIILCALCGGLTAGVGLAVVLDRLDNKFNSPEDMQRLLEVPIVGNVPTMSAELGCPPSMVMAQAPASVEAESFRSIRTWLFFAKDAQVLSVSSPLQGDGKSTIIANVGSVLAQAGKRTLIIDCDFRRPRQQNLWSLPSSRGISYLLQKSLVSPEAIKAEVCASAVEHLEIMPAGPIPANPAELLERPEMLDILQWAKTTYDYVLIDAPPLIPVADAGTIARLVDGMILVVNVKGTGRGQAYQAKSKIESAGGTLLGVIANGISRQTSYGYAYGDSYGYGYGQGDGPSEQKTEETAGPDESPSPSGDGPDVTHGPDIAQAA